MRSDMLPGNIFRARELPNFTYTLRKVGELRGDDR